MSSKKDKSISSIFLGKATTQTLVAIIFIFMVQSISQILIGNISIFTLMYPLSQDPISIVLSVYSHAGIGHLLSNAIALIIFGYLVETATSGKRFHTFFILTGIVAGIAEITFWIMFSGTAIQVLGASGAIFGLMGYALMGNDLSHSVIDFLELSKPKMIGLFVIISIIITLSTGGSGVALVAHGTGLIIGLISGYFKLLHLD